MRIRKRKTTLIIKGTKGIEKDEEEEEDRN